MALVDRGTVLVTGGAGYIGSHTVLALRDAGRRVVVLDDLSTGRRDLVGDAPFVLADVSDRYRVGRTISEHQVTAVMHFAGSIVVPESVIDPYKYYSNNTARTLELARLCVEHGVGPFVFSSTAAVYGEPPEGLVDEDAPLAPINPYGRSKLMSEIMLQDLVAAHPGFRCVRLRYFNVAGADPAGRSGQCRAEQTHIIPVALETALGKRPTLRIFGDDFPTRDGTGERDYIHVWDLALAHVAALNYLEQGGDPGAFNCGYGRGVTVREVVAAVEAVIGRPLPVERAPRREGDPARLVSDPRRLRQAMDWTPRHDRLDEMVATALAWETRHGAGGPACA